MKELEHELEVSSGEAKKFEELHKESGSHAESETQRALEFERLLEAAKQSSKEMEYQMASLQEEVKGLYEKVSENQKVEEALKSTTAELSAANEELAASKSQLLEIEQRLSSKEALNSPTTPCFINFFIEEAPFLPANPCFILLVFHLFIAFLKKIQSKLL